MSPKLVLTLSAILSIIHLPAQAKRIAPEHAEMRMHAAPRPPSARMDMMPIRPPVIIDTQRPNNNRPTVEIAFVLDTTGSMGGLIDGAKSRIWGIINEVMERPERPNVRVGLVAYRDRGDEYVTQITPLSNNIDQVYTQLMSYQADGGGDGPEDVRSALRDGVQRLQWSNASNPKAAKIIFLVGDAPPHDDYSNLPDTLSSARYARQRSIIINTIQCGGDSETTRIWKQIANAGNGRYFAINQNGGVKIFETPYDNQLAELSAQLDNSYIAYGSSSLRSAAKESNSKMQADIAMAAPAPAKAERAKNKAINSAAFDKQELVQSVENGEVKLEAIPTEQLPEVLQKKSLNERKTWLNEQSKTRAALRAKITALSKQRDAYIANEKKKAANGHQDGFDEAVSKALKEQIR